MEPQRMIEAIANCGPFGALPAHARTHAAGILQDIGTLRTRQPGEHLIQAGHLGFCDGYVLLEGAAAVQTAGGREIALNAPALLGEMAQFKQSDRRTATVLASSEVTLIDFDWDEFYERVEAELPQNAAAVRHGIELLVWQRFNHPELLALPLFRGLPDDLMLKVCMPFAWLTERKAYAGGERLFATGDRCMQTGHLLTRGTVKLKSDAQKREWTAASPHLIGVMPKSDPSLLWTADAAAAGEAVTYSFQWPAYLAGIQKRLTPAEQQQMIEAMKANAKECLWH